jgi:hypothetical protein
LFDSLASEEKKKDGRIKYHSFNKLLSKTTIKLEAQPTEPVSLT